MVGPYNTLNNVRLYEYPTSESGGEQPCSQPTTDRWTFVLDTNPGDAVAICRSLDPAFEGAQELRWGDLPFYPGLLPMIPSRCY